jgi:hypothetical protein
MLARVCDDGIRGNPADPRSGTGLQDARDPAVEETVEVVRDHEGGTGSGGVAATARGVDVSAYILEWTPRGETEEGRTRRTNPRRGRWSSDHLLRAGSAEDETKARRRFDDASNTFVERPAGCRPRSRHRRR